MSINQLCMIVQSDSGHLGQVDETTLTEKRVFISRQGACTL